jgi:ketopantoate reductase
VAYPSTCWTSGSGHKKQFLGHYAIKVTERLAPPDGFDLVVVPTKHYHLVDVLKQIVPLTGDADYLLLTQNWAGTQEIDTILPPSRYVFGDAKAGGCFQDGRLIATLATIDVGQIDSRKDGCLQKVVALCQSADIEPTVHDDILHYLWVQYAITGGLWPALVRAGSFEAVLRDRQLGEQALDAAKESLEVAARRGVDLKKYPETRMYLDTSFLMRQFAAVMMKVMFRLDRYMQRSSSHALDDPQEIGVFFFDLLNTGRELGVAMPAMSAFEPDVSRLGSRSE